MYFFDSLGVFMLDFSQRKVVKMNFFESFLRKNLDDT